MRRSTDATQRCLPRPEALAGIASNKACNEGPGTRRELGTEVHGLRVPKGGNDGILRLVLPRAISCEHFMHEYAQCPPVDGRASGLRQYLNEVKSEIEWEGAG